jgi:serpin B
MIPRRPLLPLVALTLAACGKGGGGSNDVAVQRSALPRDTAPSVPAGDATQLAADDQAFAVDLYQALRTQPGNLIVSPTSVSLALAMLYNGAAGGTATEIATALHFTLPVDRLNAAFDAMDLSLTTPPAAADASAFQLSIANSIWTQRGFTVQPPFLDALATSYGAGVNTADFEANPEGARSDINQWVSDKTQAEIPMLFPAGSIDSSTRLVLADAVYFHGDWVTPFDPDSPTGTFHAPGGDVTATVMLSDNNAQVSSGPGWNAATLAYKGGTTRMVLVVPDSGTFDAFEQGLTSDQLHGILTATTSTSGLSLPKFKFRTAETLNGVLAALGMPGAFTTSADFSGVDGRQDLQIQMVVHQADIAVDEKGTTAAAATGASLKLTSLPLRLVIDRPFLFYIVHQPTGAILFTGRVLDPTAG